MKDLQRKESDFLKYSIEDIILPRKDEVEEHQTSSLCYTEGEIKHISFIAHLKAPRYPVRKNEVEEPQTGSL